MIWMWKKMRRKGSALENKTTPEEKAQRLPQSTQASKSLHWQTNGSIQRPVSSSSICSRQTKPNRVKKYLFSNSKWRCVGHWDLPGKEHLHSRPANGNRCKSSPVFWDVFPGEHWCTLTGIYHRQASEDSFGRRPACHGNNLEESNSKLPLHFRQGPE